MVVVLFFFSSIFLFFFFFNDPATTEIYTLSLHDALPILPAQVSHQRHRPLDDVTHHRQPPRPRQVPSAAPEPDALQKLESHQPHELVSRSPERSGIGRRGRDAMTGCRKKRASGPTAPLAQREALRHSVADLATALEAARLLVYHAASLYAEGAECVSEVSMTERMITNTSAAAPRSVGAITSSRLAMSLRRLRSVLAQLHVLEFLVRVMIRRRHVVLHLRPVHHAPRPPDARDVVHVPEHDLLDLVDELLAFCGIQSPRLAREEVVDPRIGESPPVVAVARGVPLEELVGVIHEVERRADDQFEVAGVPAIREPGRRLERPVLDLDADLAPLLDHEHTEVGVRDSDVAVFQNRFESVGVTCLGQEAFGLGAILLHVLPEARKLLKLGVRYRPLRRRTHQPADVLEARDGVEHATRGVPIETKRQRLTDAFVVEGLDRLVHRDAEDAGGRCILHDHLVAELLPDRLDLRLRHGAELDVRAPGANGRRAHRRLRADEELVAIEIRSVLDEIVGVPLAFERGSGRAALELEGPGPDDVRLEVVRILVEVLLRIDHVPRRGQIGQE